MTTESSCHPCLLVQASTGQIRQKVYFQHKFILNSESIMMIVAEEINENQIGVNKSNITKTSQNTENNLVSLNVPFFMYTMGPSSHTDAVLTAHFRKSIKEAKILPLNHWDPNLINHLWDTPDLILINS